MALLSCPECGKQVSQHAPSCPNCGYPLAAPSSSYREPAQRIVIQQPQGSATGEGFGKGFGCVLGGVLAVVIICVALFFVSRVAQPCPTCNGSGNCTLCGGSGKGIFTGNCMVCSGNKKCKNCGGSGFKLK